MTESTFNAATSSGASAHLRKSASPVRIVLRWLGRPSVLEQQAKTRLERRRKTTGARGLTRRGAVKRGVQGILGTQKRLQPPCREEGFDRLYCVTVTEANEFLVEECPERFPSDPAPARA